MSETLRSSVRDAFWILTPILLPFIYAAFFWFVSSDKDVMFGTFAIVFVCCIPLMGQLVGIANGGWKFSNAQFWSFLVIGSVSAIVALGTVNYIIGENYALMIPVSFVGLTLICTVAVLLMDHRLNPSKSIVLS